MKNIFLVRRLNSYWPLMKTSKRDEDFEIYRLPSGTF